MPHVLTRARAVVGSGILAVLLLACYGTLVFALAACGHAVPVAAAPALIVPAGTTVRLGDVVPDDVIAYYWEILSPAERASMGVASLDELRDYRATGPAVVPYFTTRSPSGNPNAVGILTDSREVERRVADARTVAPSDDMRRQATEAVINARVPAIHIPSGATVRTGDVFHDDLIVDTWDSFSPMERESMRQRNGPKSLDDFRDIRRTGPAMLPAVAGEIPIKPPATDPCAGIVVSEVVVEVPVSAENDTGTQSPPLPENAEPEVGEGWVSVPVETVEPCEVPPNAITRIVHPDE